MANRKLKILENGDCKKLFIHWIRSKNKEKKQILS